jgi:hypothetical protein
MGCWMEQGNVVEIGSDTCAEVLKQIRKLHVVRLQDSDLYSPLQMVSRSRVPKRAVTRGRDPKRGLEHTGEVGLVREAGL